MSSAKEKLERKRSEAADARARLTGTMLQLQQRLKPAALINEAVGEMREKVAELSQEGIEMARSRPVAVAGIGVALLVYVFRGMLWSKLVAAFSRRRETVSDAGEFQDEQQMQGVGGEAFPRRSNGE